MKLLIFISGTIGVLLLLIRLIGEIMLIPHENILFWLGLGLIFLITFPLIVYSHRMEKQKIRRILTRLKNKKSNPSERTQREKPKIKGWGMNDSPFRERKSGLTWGGGNVKGANARRETRRKFLR